MLSKVLNCSIVYMMMAGVAAMAETTMTRGELAQKLMERNTALPLRCLVANVLETLPSLEKCDRFADVPYDHPRGNAIFMAVANGWIGARPDGSFGDAENLPADEQAAIMARANGERRFSGDVAAAVTAIVGNGKSRLTQLVGTTVYKSASLALDGMEAAERTAVRAALEKLKADNRPQGDKIDVVGSSTNPMTWIYRYPKGVFVREIWFRSNKRDTLPVEIVQLNDTHYNLINDRDEAEQNPAVMSTKLYRKWLAGGSSKWVVRKALAFARYADLTIVAGDVLDFLSWGCRQLTTEELFRSDVTLMACLGGHDTTRQMQGKVGDPSPYATRRAWLQEFWPHDIMYASKVLRDKVICVVMDNGASRFWKGQIEPLKADIAKAREHGWIMLLFMHEPICTRNPQETAVKWIRQNDPSIVDFCNRLVGHPKSNADTLAVYDLITHNADVVKGVFCGHQHSDFYAEIIGSYVDAEGKTVPAKIPQIVATGTVYDNTGHVVKIIVE